LFYFQIIYTFLRICVEKHITFNHKETSLFFFLFNGIIAYDTNKCKYTLLL